MFTWICPQCGREVPPSYSECPNCAPAQPAAPVQAPPPPQVVPQYPQPVPPPQQAPPPQAAPPPLPPPQPPYAPPPPPQPAYAPPPQAGPPQAAPPQAYAPPPPQPPQAYYPQPAAPPPFASSPLFGAPAPAEPVPAARVGLPTWLMSLIFALAFLGAGACIYWVVQHLQGGGSSASTTAPASQAAPKLENVPAQGQAAAQENPLQKYVEVTGVRFLQNAKKQTEARFVVVNHSGADAADLSATVKILGRTQKEGEEPVGQFTFQGVSLGPYESKELSAPLQTKLRVYELPDWQMTDTRVQLSSR
ncbi:MAG TPA: hypothetical protein VFA33_29120 [Bryobacteraceae bacterium]|nr:hypothetical protein [Bryobacteraceae bacterium]